MKTTVLTVLVSVVLSSSHAWAEDQSPGNVLANSAIHQSSSNWSSLKPEVKGAVIGAAIGAGTGLLINYTLNDGDRTAGSYFVTAGAMAALFALIGYGAGLKHGRPFGRFPSAPLLRVVRSPCEAPFPSIGPLGRP